MGAALPPEPPTGPPAALALAAAPDGTAAAAAAELGPVAFLKLRAAAFGPKFRPVAAAAVGLVLLSLLALLVGPMLLL